MSGWLDTARRFTSEARARAEATRRGQRYPHVEYQVRPDGQGFALYSRPTQSEGGVYYCGHSSGVWCAFETFSFRLYLKHRREQHEPTRARTK